MKLRAPFVQLPVLFDADRLAAEVASLGPDAWRPHPQGYEGNDFLPLISAHGDPQSEAFGGPMRPTPYLSSSDRPYLQEVLASLGAVLGRTRLMRLSGHAEVVEHADANYYWRDRMRVHIPIITQPTVSFHCGDAMVNMGPGECWIFDTWRLHKVINDAERSRIHLVADTVGGEGFWELARRGRASDAPAPANWTAQKIEPSGAKHVLEFESVNVPIVMSPGPGPTIVRGVAWNSVGDIRVLSSLHGLCSGSPESGGESRCLFGGSGRAYVGGSFPLKPPMQALAE